MNRDESYKLFLQEKEQGVALFKKIMNASIEELVILATSPNEEERWLAQWQLKRVDNSKE